MIYDKVVLLITGASGVGKSTIAEKLCENEQYNLIRSYTNRPPRSEDDDDHIYVEDGIASTLLREKQVVASTVYGGYVYFTLAEQFIDNMINVYIVDDLGVCNTINYMRRWKDTGYATVRIRCKRWNPRQVRDYSFLDDDHFMMVVDNDDKMDYAVEEIDGWLGGLI